MPHMIITDTHLDRAVAAGIITGEQRDQLLALLPGEGAGAASERAPGILVAYTAGALAVLFAFGWFLIERWQALGPPGVLVVACVYAALFALTSWRLKGAGFPLAAGFAALLAVAMTPIATWAVLQLTGFWGGGTDDLPPGQAIGSTAPPTRWAVVELTTALAALVTWRFGARFAPLTLPVALAGWLAPLHLAAPFSDPLIAPGMFGWGSLAAGAFLLLAAAYMERRISGDPAGDLLHGLRGDPVRWVYAVATVAFLAGVVVTWSDSIVVRHGVLALALALAVHAVALGRRGLLVAAAAAFVAYLAYLAFDVFDRVLSFPVVLATFGLAIILLTVAAQRRWPALSARLAAARAGQRRLPGGYAIPGALLVGALVLLVGAPDRARAGAERRHREQLRSIREAGEVRRREAAAGRPSVRRAVPTPAETPPPRGP